MTRPHKKFMLSTLLVCLLMTAGGPTLSPAQAHGASRFVDAGACGLNHYTRHGFRDYLTVPVGAGRLIAKGTTRSVPFRRICGFDSLDRTIRRYNPSVRSITVKWTWKADGKVLRRHTAVVSNDPSSHGTSDKLNLPGITYGDDEQGAYLHNDPITVEVSISHPGYATATFTISRYGAS